MRKTIPSLIAISLLWIVIPGCSPPDQRAIEVARESMQRQAEQNKVMAEQSQKTTEAAEHLVKEQSAARKELTQVQEKMVERDAQGRQDLNRLQQDVQKSSTEAQSRVDQGRTELEAERRAIARDRQRAPVVAEAVREVGLLVVCLLPLLVAAYVLYTLQSHPSQDDTLTETLVAELAAEEPHLLSYQKRPELEPPGVDASRPVLPGPEDLDEEGGCPF